MSVVVLIWRFFSFERKRAENKSFSSKHLSAWFQRSSLFRFVQCMTLLPRTCLTVVFTDKAFYATPNAVKLAYVDGCFTFIYRDCYKRGLKLDDAALAHLHVRHLQALADKFGLRYFEDRRERPSEVSFDRRSRLSIGAFVCWWLGTLAPNCWSDSEFAYIDGRSSDTYMQHEQGFYSSSANNTTRIQTLGLFSSRLFDDLSLSAKKSKTVDFENSLNTLDHRQLGFSEERYRKARSVLFKKWKKSAHDVDNLEMQLDELARYLASQTEPYALLLSLKNKPLRLVYSPDNFTTVVKGSQFHVRSATIYFDPQRSAELSTNSRCGNEPGYCVASPADAFIHELIHAKIALLEPDRFIKSGAMNSLVYPYAHEREVLSAERAIYHSMTQHDKKPRPRRHSHSGHLQVAACVSCVDSG